MVVGGEVVTLKSIEESSGLIIAEMPINVSLLLVWYCPNALPLYCKRGALHVLIPLFDITMFT